MSEKNDREKEKRRLWEVDPGAFQPLPKASPFQRRVVPPLRTIGRFSLLGLALAYPIALVTLGLLFGGLVFWGSFAGSALILWLVLARLGFARNFAGWGVGWRKSAGVLIAFPVTLGFYLGLIYLKLLFVPVLFGVLALGALLLFRNANSNAETQN